MIAGTIVIEDSTLHFHARDGGWVEYTIQEGLEGRSATVDCQMEAFAAALAIALNPAGEVPAVHAAMGNHADADDIVNSLWKAAEEAQPLDAALRWIP